MRPDEAAGVARLVGLALTGAATLAQDVQVSASDRVFDAVGQLLGPGVERVRVLNDGAVAGVYAAVRAGLGIGSWAAAQIASARVRGESGLSEHPKGNRALAVVNAFYGDLLHEARSPLTVTMQVRLDGHDLPLDPESLAAAYPGASGRVVVFLHGLAENEDSWFYKSQERHGEPGISYGVNLHRDFGYTPVYLRFNTGLRVSDNGARLAALLTELVAGWPAPVETMVLVGHSMGGLVIHSALAVGGPWADLVDHTISLGSPHLGAPLEQVVARLSHEPSAGATAQVLSRVLRSRSVGIKDLRHGNLVEADWQGHHPDDPVNRRTPVSPHPVASHRTLSGTITRDPHHPIGAMLGDLMVRPGSAGGLDVPADQVARVGGLHHLDLLNHPRVYEQIAAWLTPGPPPQVGDLGEP